MKRIIPLVLPVLALLAIGCTNDDIAMETPSVSAGFTPVGNPVEVAINFYAEPFTVDASTRAEDPKPYEPTHTNELAAIELESEMKTAWLFEYDKTSRKLINDPLYFTISGSSTDAEKRKFYNLGSVSLRDNNGEPVILYTIVNADMKSDVSEWVKLNETTGEYDGFMTIDSLEAQTLPTTYVQKSTYTDTWPPSYINNNAKRQYIPKSGYRECTLDGETDSLHLNVTNMYARLMVYATYPGLTKDDLFDYNICVENVPLWCTVGPLADATTTAAYKYPDSVQWTYTSVGPQQSDSYLQANYPEGDILFIVYVPENIQGEVSDYEEGATRADIAPESQYGTDESTGLTTKKYDDPTYTTKSPKLNGISSKTDAMAVHFYPQRESDYFGPIYVGGNDLNNFNVRRNCSYRIIFNIEKYQEGGKETEVDMEIVTKEPEDFFKNEGTYTPDFNLN